MHKKIMLMAFLGLFTSIQFICALELKVNAQTNPPPQPPPQQDNYTNNNNGAIVSPDMYSSKKTPSRYDTYFTYYSSIIGYKSNGLWGFYSKNGQINIPPIYTNIEALNSQYIKIQRNGYWGLIDVSGNQLMQPAFSSIETISVGTGDLFKVKKDGLYGVSDAYGNLLIPIYYQDLSKLNNSYLKIKQNDRYGVYAIYEGREIIPPLYEGIMALNSYFMFRTDGKWGLMDKNEKIIIQALYDDINVINNYYFAVKNNKVWGTVSAKTGEEIIEPKYDKIEFGKSQYLKVKHGGKWGAVTFEGEIAIPIEKGPLEINRELKKLY